MALKSGNDHMVKKKGPKKRQKTRISVSGSLVTAGLLYPIYDAIQFGRVNGFSLGVSRLITDYIGYSFTDKTWYPNQFMTGGGLIGTGIGMHYVGKEMQVNKMLGRMKVPLIRM